MTIQTQNFRPSTHASTDIPHTRTDVPRQTHFNNQEILDSHLPDRLTPNYYEMLSPSHEGNSTDMNIIKKTASYLRNEHDQRKYSGGGPIGFVITREPRTGHKHGIIHFYTEGVYALAAHHFKADGSTESRGSQAAEGVNDN